jgi:GT2 family glycosyltransferase
VSKRRVTDAKARRAPVTVVVVNCNGGIETLKCLRSVAASDPAPERVVLVDNGSTDGTRDLIEKEYEGNVPLIGVWLATNVGPAAARNIGAHGVSSAYIAFLDNDTVVTSTWLSGALETMERQEADCAQCKLLVGGTSGRLDSVGYLLGPFGFPRHIVRRGALDLLEYQQPRLLFGVTSAAMVITRAAFEKLGGFDPLFFIYGEETDLCWRLLRMGGKIVLAPHSVVLHHSGGTARFLPEEADVLLYRGGTRNYIQMVAKNSPSKRVYFDLAGQVTLWLGASTLQALRGRIGISGLILRGIGDAAASLPTMIRERRRSTLPFDDVPRELRMRFSLRYIWRTVGAI